MEQGKRQTRVYVAGAYSADNVIKILDNMRVGLRASKDVMLAGFAPFSPWLDYLFSLMLEGDEALTIDDYYRYSIAWLEASDCMVIVSGRETSTGVAKERDRAKQLGIPIYNSLDELVTTEPRWRDAAPLDAMHTIGCMVPGRVLNAIADGLKVGLNKGYDRWDSDKGTEHYMKHLLVHLSDMSGGKVYDEDDGHTNGSGVIIRGMQLLDRQLIEEAQCESSRLSDTIA
jgi:hypothetical protein